ncbi:hypothetical protein CLV56_0826 [Mumia flava]|uniref:DNA-binding MarR family transcriptional regulator n=1 Tax=Mumia flava TaxID=1348852 RepID=A0A0B2BK05_9ACTN|nr:hypothetical protein [Mumia flava]PJJ56616.1 hypothetical protein CLV56_0826 [Mumia flava]
MTTSTTDNDAALARQVAAYWTRRAYESVITFTRREQRLRGYTQPQFWLLRHLDAHDLAEDDQGATVAELEHAMAEYLREEDDLDTEADTLVARGWLEREGVRLRITEAGKAGRLELARHAPAIRALIHDGIDDADYVTTIKVLQRLIHNTREDRALER